MKKILSALVILPLWAMAAELPSPVAHWNFVDETEWRRPAEGGMSLQTGEGVTRVADARFDAAVTIADGLTLPRNLVDLIRDEGTISFWLYTERPPNDATHQPLLSTGSRPMARELRLRWNRFFVYENLAAILDTQPAGRLESSLDKDVWAPVAFSWKGGEGEVMLRGMSIGRFKLNEGNFVQDGMVIGSATFKGKLTHLRVYDQVLTAEQSKAVAALNIPADVPGEDDPAPNCPGETLGMKKRQTGYTIAELKKFPALEEWPDWAQMTKIADSYDASRFKPAPAPYVHPRVIFNADDLPAIRERMAQSTIGKKYMEGVRARSLQLSPDPEPWEVDFIPGANANKNREAYAAKGMLIGKGRYGYHGPWMGGWMDTLAGGTMSGEIKEDLAKPQHERTFRYLMHQMPYEAFRCLIDEDREGLARCGRAVATIARHFMSLPKYQELGEGDSWQAIYQLINSHTIGLVYDFAYNEMSQQDQDDVRKFIAMMTAGKNILPFQAVPALPANTTNWLGIHTNMLPMIMAIEGEEGYDPIAHQAIIEAQKKWAYVATGPLGAAFEGFSKSGYMPWWMLYMAKRGDNLIGTEYSRNVYRKFELHNMVPWGRGHIHETHIGPVDQGIAYMKYAHPKDPVIDMLYGEAVEAVLGGTEVYWPNTRTTYPPIYLELFTAMDPLGVEADGSYDFDATFEKTMAYLRHVDEPLSYYSDYRGLMTARTAWDKDAVMFFMEPRNVAGGHTHGSRNGFLVVGLGREWSSKYQIVEAPSSWHSVMLVDGKGQGWEGGKCPQGKTVDYIDTEDATFLVGDATWAYSYNMVNKTSLGDPMPITPNDSRFYKSSLPWMDMPWSDLPQWLSGAKPSRKAGAGHSHWRPYNPVEYSFRTGGLIRGKYPYSLVIDDMKKDSDARTYTWQMQLAPDLTVEKNYAQGMLDLTLVEPGDRRCLVRSVEAGGQAVSAAVANASGHDPLETQNRRKQPQTNNRLTINAQSTQGDFKTLIYPYRPGMPEMITKWNPDRSQLGVMLGDQVDVFSFKKQADGRTVVSMKRNGQKIF